MEKYLLRKLFLLMSTGFVLSACGTETTEAPEETEEPDVADVEESEDAAEEEASEEAETAADEITADFDIVVDGESVADLSEEITVPEGTYLLDAMEETYDLEEEGGFISAIEGYEQDEDEGLYWLYYINDEMPSVGAADYELEDGDQIEWSLEK